MTAGARTAFVLLAAAALMPGQTRAAPARCAAGSARGQVLAASVPTILAPLAGRWRAALSRADVRVSLSLAAPAPPQGALDPALRAFLDGRGDVAFLTRDIAEEDLARFRRAHGTDPVVIPVAGGSWHRFGYVDPVVFIVNAANPLRSLDFARIDGIFSATRWRARSAVVEWGAAGVPAWRGQAIHLAGGDAWASTESARALTVRRRVLSVGSRIGRWRLAPDSGGDADNVERVVHDPLAIGFTGAGHVLPGTRVVPIAPFAGSRPLLPKRANVARGRYPLARTVDMLVARRSDGTIATAAARLARFLVGREGQRAIAEDGAFLPLTPAQRRAALRTVRSSPAC